MIKDFRVIKLRRSWVVAMAAMIGSLAVGFQPAQADMFGAMLGDGFSKDNPTAPPDDLTSIFGASLVGSRIRFDTDTGVLRAEIFNSGSGTMTGFGLALSDAFNGLTPTFSFTPGTPCDDCIFVNDSPASNDTAGPFDNAEPGGFDVGATRQQQGGVGNGLEAGERVTFIWNFDGEFGAIDSFFGDGGVTDVVTRLDVTVDGNNAPPGIQLSAFWVAHIQELGDNQGDSDRIGGTAVSEPGAIALIGLGLVALGAYRRRAVETM